MGDEFSKPAPATSAEDQQRARVDARKLNEHFEAGKTDGRSAVLGAFGDDASAQAKIEKIVGEIENYGSKEPSASRSEALGKASVAQRREERARKAAARQAERTAESWLEQQVREGASAEAAARAEKAEREAAAAAIAEARAFAQVVRPAFAPPNQSIIDLLRAQAAFRDCEQSRGSRSIFAQLPAPKQPREPAVGDEEPPVPPAPPLNLEDAPEFYKLLGVGVDATFEDIRQGYRKEALKWHPDKNRNNLTLATERFKKISEAFDTLFDPGKKEAYDSGKVKRRKAKKLQGHGWADIADEDDAALTVEGWKWKRQSWRIYVFFRGRIDDEDPIWEDPVNDPRVPQEKIKVFWRHIGEMAYEARNEGNSSWLGTFVARVWKDTPARWPSAVELKGMSEAAREEWKERRMVYNRRKQKALLHIDLHEAYLAIPGRIKKERARLAKLQGFRMTDDGSLVHVVGDGSTKEEQSRLRLNEGR